LDLIQGGEASKASTKSLTQGKVGASKWEGKVPRNLFQRHHIVTNKSKAFELEKHPIWEKAGLNPEGWYNKIFLPTKEGAKVTGTQRSLHVGRHRAEVHRDLRRKLNDTIEQGEASQYTQGQYREALLGELGKERWVLRSGERLLNNAKP
jgi:hypothetical protein